MNNKIVKTSKFLSLVLRHKPEEIGIILDDNGWVSIDTLIDAANRKKSRNRFTRALIEEVVHSNDKQRFTISDDGETIRANQGHSVNIDLELVAKKPPARLYHGTVEKFLEAIKNNGLNKMSRRHVHLTENSETAVAVGSRRGKPIILEVSSDEMFNEGYEFYQSANGVWLTDSVPVTYIKNFDIEGVF